MKERDGSDVVGTVVFEDASFCLDFGEKRNNEISRARSISTKWYEVIGNIYENAELLSK